MTEEVKEEITRDGEIVEVSQESQGGITAREKGMWETLLEHVQRNPRNIGACMDQATAMACRDQETAESCFYAMPRGGKMVTGPSIRLAEMMQSAFGGLLVETRNLAIGARQLTAEGTCIDLHTLTRARTEVTRRITGKNGQRYNDDMINTTSMAAQAIARRNAIFAVVPRAYVDQVEKAARKVAVGDEKTLVQRRGGAIQTLNKMGVPTERILSTIDRQSIEEITGEDVLTLRSLWIQVKDEGKSIDLLFPDPTKPTPGEDAAAAQSAIERLAQKKAEEPETKPERQ